MNHNRKPIATALVGMVTAWVALALNPALLGQTRSNSDKSEAVHWDSQVVGPKRTGPAIAGPPVPESTIRKSLPGNQSGIVVNGEFVLFSKPGAHDSARAEVIDLTHTARAQGAPENGRFPIAPPRTGQSTDRVAKTVPRDSPFSNKESTQRSSEQPGKRKSVAGQTGAAEKKWDGHQSNDPGESPVIALAQQPATRPSTDSARSPSTPSTIPRADPAALRRTSRAPDSTAVSSNGNASERFNGVTNHPIGVREFKMADQPLPEAHFDQGAPVADRLTTEVPPEVHDFSPTPVPSQVRYDPADEILVYEGKWLNANQRPWVELGRPWYQLGQLAPSPLWLGRHNPMSPQLMVYGDYRMAYANNILTDESVSQVAFELNLNFDLRLTATERITAFIAPLDHGNQNTRWLLDDDRVVDELDADVDFGMFEGDLGALVGGFSGQTLPFDLPFAIGVMPMLIQNGVWMEDAILGAAATVPARNSPALDISNMDLTFFAAWDEIDSPAFENDDDAARMYGVAAFIEAAGGYFEVDYAFLEDKNRIRDRSYHNIGIAYTRRYGRWLSNSVRVIANAGQQTGVGPGTADGTLILLENSLITSAPHTFVPYFNLWAGFDHPQSAARAAGAGGILRNTGILFETDGLTGYPTLDATANNTWGGALGLNILSRNFDQQLILELAILQAFGDPAFRAAPDDQYGVGARYQLPISNDWLIRTDAMYGFLRNSNDLHGARLELRHKF